MTFVPLSRRAAAQAACALVFFCSSGVSHAQNDRGSGPLEFTITAYRGETPIARSGSAVTVIHADEIKKANPVTILDVFRGLPGVSVNQTGGPGSLSTILLRGAEARHTLVLIDGIRVNDPSSTGGEFDFANLVETDIERIEVLRGPQSALYGSDAIGGVINIITRKGRGEPRSSIQLEGGSYGTYSTRMSTSGGVDNFSYALALLAARSTGFSAYGYRIPALEALYGPFDKDGFTRFAGSARFAWRLNDQAEIEAGFYGGYLRNGYDAAFAGFGFLPDTPSISKTFLTTAFVRGTFDALDGALRHRVTAYSSDTDRILNDVQRTDFGFGVTDSFDRFQFRGRRYGGEYQGDLALGSYGKLIFGGNVERESAQTKTVPGVNSFNLFESNYYARTGVAGFALYQQTLFDRLDISLGGRYDHVEDVRGFLTGRATAAWRIEETGTKLRASAGTGAKAPSLYQQFGLFAPTRSGYEALVPETSWGVDAGIDQILADGRAKLSATIFNNSIRNMIDFDNSLPSNTPFGTGVYVNVARARIWGAELAGEAIIIPEMVSVRGSYTFLHARDETNGFELARRPAHQGRASILFTPIEKLSIEPTVYLVGERFSTPLELDRLAPYARLDARIAYQATKNFEVYVRAENLTDVRYQEVKNYGTAGRSFYAGLRAMW
ncbi:MAG: TonB-dependent receptor [Beijerinckiaceae bacterium]